MSVILKTHSLTKQYGRQKAVHNISLSVNQGDIYGLIGKNGAGKTTLLRIISNLARPSQGTYEVFGRSRTDREAATRVSCLIENTGIYPHLSARDHLLLKGKALGLVDKTYIPAILEAVGLADTGRKSVKQFSLGMKQRLGIGLALVGQPDLVILDEPINGLDPQGIVEVRQLIARLNRDGMTFIISSHILEELAKLANRFGIIDNGSLIAEISRSELEEKSRDRIELSTPQTQKASLLLDRLGLADYHLVDEVTFYIYSGLDRINEIVLAIAREDIAIEGFSVHKGSLEDYYLSLTREEKLC